MAWNDVIGQERVKQILQNAFVQDRIASSYLFTGSEGIGKDALAIEFAKLLNCPNPIIEIDGQKSKAEITPEFDKKHKENALFHQNIISVFGIPAPKPNSKDEVGLLSGLADDQVKEIQEELAKKSKDPYYKMNISGTLAIRVSQVRKVKQILKMSTPSNGKRVIIIFDAHTMNDESSNALLKSIEEPADNTIFILITHSPDLILGTIKSRCQLIRFDPLKDAEIKKYLELNNIGDKNNLDFILPFANGSITRAIEFADEDLQILRENTIELLRNGLRKANYREKTVGLVESICSEKNRKNVQKSILLMAYWLEDCLKYSVGNKLIVNKDHEESIAKFTSVFGKKDIAKTIEYCEDSIRMVHQNVNIQMIYLSLIMKIRKVLL